MEKSITEILRDAENVEVVAIDEEGSNYVSFEDYVNATTADTINKTGIGLLPMNPDGSPAGTPHKYVAVSMEQLFLNRYRVKDGKIELVTDWWCITSQASGQIPLSRIPCYVIGRDAKKNLVYEKTISISDGEFLSDFTGSLDREAMTRILPLLTKKDHGVTKDKLPI